MNTAAALQVRTKPDPREDFADFVKTHADLVYTVALRCSGSRADAEDLTQDTFARAFVALSGYSDDRIEALTPRPWLATITTNLWRNEIRRRSRRVLESALDDEGGRGSAAANAAAAKIGGSAGPEEVALESSDRRDMAALLKQLPLADRSAVVLRHIVGFSYEEIAESLGCPVGTAKARVHRGLRKLEAMITQQSAGGRK